MQTVWFTTPYGRRCGGELVTLRGRPVFRKSFGSEHVLRQCDGIGFQLDMLKALAARGVQAVEARDRATGRRYHTTVDQLLAKGYVRNFGHGWQLFMPRRLFAQQEPGQPGLWEGAPA